MGRLQPDIRSQADGFSFTLPFPPLVESWDRKDAPSQVRLQAYRDAIAIVAAPALATLPAPIALGFHVAGRPDIGGGCDLDNFLTPVVTALGGGGRFSFAWATRGRPDERATITLVPASAARRDMRGQPSSVHVRLTGSHERVAWKQAIASAVGTHACAHREGPVELSLAFTVPPERNWISLWKPAIDALGGILGEGNRPWHPRDDRIALLVLERVHKNIGWNIELNVRWASRDS